MAVRERLYVLMGLDNVVEDCDQNTDSVQWGLPGQIAHSERGRIPDDPQTLLTRRRRTGSASAGPCCDRETIATVSGIVLRTTWHKEKRANAYDFPLDAVGGAGRRADEGSEPPGNAEAGQDGDQQQLDTVAAMGDGGQSTDGATAADADEQHTTAPGSDETATMQAQLMTAIEALQAAKESLAAD